MHIAIVTAGGAGMFCGSCMHDNTWARGLMAAGYEVSLIPLYTPITVDEVDSTTTPLFFGGINVYLESKSRLWRAIPRWLTRWADRPSVLNFASKMGVSNNAAELGELTVKMLDGLDGPQDREVVEFGTYFHEHLRPDVVIFSNALLSGPLPHLKQTWPSARYYCLIQGDDIFLNALTDAWRQPVLDRVRNLCGHYDALLVHSRYYRDYMSELLATPPERFHHLPLGIDLTPHVGTPRNEPGRPFVVGYFARICPEKGLHELVTAFAEFHRRHPETALVAGGYLGKQHEAYFRDVQRLAEPWSDAFTYVGSPATNAEKVEILSQFDVLCVPAPYHEPKGLYVLEALANGIPVVQPAHGAFPEIISATGGGLLYDPAHPAQLVDALERMYQDHELRTALARTGHAGVRAAYSLEALIEASHQLFGRQPIPSTP